jgi:putative SOS response-associated peptidase YedK
MATILSGGREFFKASEHVAAAPRWPYAADMCNRYCKKAKPAEVAQRFGIDPALIMPEPERLPPPELSTKRDGWVVHKQEGARILDVMTWGFPPPGTSRVPVTNVRNLTSPFWRSALKNPERRCLLPVTDFCEWEGEKRSKLERWLSVFSAPIFAFAGVWRPRETGKADAFPFASRTQRGADPSQGHAGDPAP